jgi:hypothetical protein
MSLVIPSTSRTVMQMSTPPTGWTKDTSFNDYALRVTTGSVTNRTTGLNFSTVFKNYTNLVCSAVTVFPVGTTTIDNTRTPVHVHFATTFGTSATRRTSPPATPSMGAPATATYATQGLSTSHGHPISTLALEAPKTIVEEGTPASIDLAIKYVDVILAIRN